ncbi:MAG TPA: AAA family ATPase [Polyangiaceae bacterium]|jgi:predicted ATPase|nr:AAA family ATPase [Polyangiaceae bacterium]
MLTSISLENFKSFRSATLPLGPFTLLVGTNASGKSNLRDALRFIHGIGREYSLAEIIDEKYGEGGERQWAGIRGGTREIAFAGQDQFRIRVELGALLGPGYGGRGFPLTYDIAVAVGDPKVGPHVLRESLYLGRFMYFDSHPSKDPPKQQDAEHLRVRIRRASARGPHGPARTFLSSSPALLQAVRKSDKRLRIAEALIPALHSMRFLDLAPNAMRIPSLPGQPVLGDQGERLSAALLAICRDEQKKQTLLEWIRVLTPLDVVDFDFPPDYTGRVLVHLIEQGGRRISAHSASDGTLRFLGMLAAMLDPGASRTYVIEELENGIHPTRLHLLVQLIEQQCRTGLVQVIATTHSPQLLGFLSPEARQSALLVYRLRGADDSAVRRVVELPDLNRILETQDLARLHASGWLEDMVELMADTAGEAAQ